MVIRVLRLSLELYLGHDQYVETFWKILNLSLKPYIVNNVCHPRVKSSHTYTFRTSQVIHIPFEQEQVKQKLPFHGSLHFEMRMREFSIIYFLEDYTKASSWYGIRVELSWDYTKASSWYGIRVELSWVELSWVELSWVELSWERCTGLASTTGGAGPRFFEAYH